MCVGVRNNAIIQHCYLYDPTFRLHSVHGNNWSAIGLAMGRSSMSVNHKFYSMRGELNSLRGGKGFFFLVNNSACMLMDQKGSISLL